MPVLILKDLLDAPLVEPGFVLGSFRFVLGSFFRTFIDFKRLLGFVFAFRVYPPGGTVRIHLLKDETSRHQGYGKYHNLD
jgi:hypothetical protein